MKPDWCFYPRTYNRRTQWCFKETDLGPIELLETLLKSRQSIEAVYTRITVKKGLKFKELLAGLGFLHWLTHENPYPRTIVGVQRAPVQFVRQIEPALTSVVEKLEVAARQKEAGRKSRTKLTDSDKGWLAWLITLLKERLEGDITQPKKAKAKRKKQTQKASETRLKETQIRLQTCLQALQSLGVKPTPAAIHKASGLSYRTIRQHLPTLEGEHPI